MCRCCKYCDLDWNAEDYYSAMADHALEKRLWEWQREKLETMEKANEEMEREFGTGDDAVRDNIRRALASLASRYSTVEYGYRAAAHILLKESSAKNIPWDGLACGCMALLGAHIVYNLAAVKDWTVQMWAEALLHELKHLGYGTP